MRTYTWKKLDSTSTLRLPKPHSNNMKKSSLKNSTPYMENSFTADNVNVLK